MFTVIFARVDNTEMVKTNCIHKHVVFAKFSFAICENYVIAK